MLQARPSILKTCCFICLFGLLLLPDLAGGKTGLGDIQVGDKTYHEVVVIKVSPRFLSIRHRGGFAQIPLSDLPPQLQAQFDYNPREAVDYARAREAAREKARQAQLQKLKNDKQDRRQANRRDILNREDTGTLLARFATPVERFEEVDLRPEYVDMELIVKNQGRRPSCSVFAVVSALEFENARRTGEAVKFSEEYLIWATRKVLGLLNLPPLSAALPGEAEELDRDAGFGLLEVVQALRAYGVASQEQMPNTIGTSLTSIASPPHEVVEEARKRRSIEVQPVTGRGNDKQLENILHVLNTRRPVVIGCAWPPARVLHRSPILAEQSPREGYGHAVTLVGYRKKGPDLEDTLFIFKNSWGQNWGVNGYGYAEWAYLKEHLQAALFLDVRP